MISLNFVEFDCSRQGDGGSGDFLQSKFICICCFEGGECGSGDVVDVGVKIHCDCDSQVRIGDVCVVGCILLGETALDRTEEHALDVVCDHARCGVEGCMSFERKNLCFQFGRERLEFDESSSPRGDWFSVGLAGLVGGLSYLLIWRMSCLSAPKCAARRSVMIGSPWLLTRSG